MAERPPVRLLEPLCALVSVCAVLTLVAFPAVTASKPAPPDAEVTDCLDRLRTAIWHYGVEHGDALGPKLPGQDGQVQTLVAQLTLPSDRDGHTEVQGRDDRRWFGPYLPALPVNPRNGLDTIRVAPTDALSAEPDGSAGWIYLPATGEVQADLPWSDRRGIPYADY